jgi:hypothetical protein
MLEGERTAGAGNPGGQGQMSSSARRSTAPLSFRGIKKTCRDSLDSADENISPAWFVAESLLGRGDAAAAELGAQMRQLLAVFRFV